MQDIQKTLSAIIETFTPSSLEESVQQIKALSLNDPPNLNYLSNLILQKVSFSLTRTTLFISVSLKVLCSLCSLGWIRS